LGPEEAEKTPEEEGLSEEPERTSQEAPPDDWGGYARHFFDISKTKPSKLPTTPKSLSPAGKVAGKTASRAAGKVASKAASKATGSALGSALGSVLPGIGTALGALVGSLASKIVEVLGPKLIKTTFFALLAFFLLLATLSLVFWGILGGGKYFGRSAPVLAQQQIINKFLAWNGDPIELRRLIVEESDNLKKELESAKNIVDSLNLTTDKKEGVKKKINEAISLIDEIKSLLSGPGTTLPTLAKEKTDKLISLLKDIKQILPFMAFYGDFALPLGSLTCTASHNKSPHTLAAHGHGVFLVRNNDGGALDYSAPAGSAVYAISDGRITKILYHKRWQNYVVFFKSDDGRYEVVYGHITKEVESGEKITKGQVIGRILPGRVKPHLHLELWIDGNVVKERAQLPYFCGGQ